MSPYGNEALNGSARKPKLVWSPRVICGTGSLRADEALKDLADKPLVR